MKIVFNNLGPIKQGSIEMGKLTVLAGKNNTGKTYVTYTIFSLYHFLTYELDLTAIAREIAKDLKDTGKSLVTISSQEIKDAFHESIKSFGEDDFSRIFSSDPSRFESSTIDFLFDESDLKPKSAVVVEAEVKTKGIQLQISFHPQVEEQSWRIESTVIVNENIDVVPTSNFMRAIKQTLIAYFLNRASITKPYLSTSERLGIALFYKDLDSNRNALVEHLQKMATSKGNTSVNFDPFEFIEKVTSRFALPIGENINFVRKLESVQKNVSELSEFDLCEYITRMMGGGYKFVNDEIIFSNNKRGKNKVSFPIHLGSSSLRSLADVFFYLKHSVKKNDLLMIDEPESHLTPQNQIILTRMLGALVNQGVNVYVTTHSDYIIKELNNLIMLSKINKNILPNYLKKYGYHEKEILSFDDVKAYICEKGTINECKKTEYGIELPNLDEAIRDLNERAFDIANSLDESD